MKRLTLVVLSLAWALGGCAAVLPDAAPTLQDLKRTIRDVPSQLDNDQRLADLGFAAIAEGNLGLAETYLDAALAINPNNPYALLNLGVVYQHTGRMPAARRLYNKLTVLDPPDTAVTATRERQVGTRLVDIARSNLAQLDADAALAGLPAPSPEDAPHSVRTVAGNEPAPAVPAARGDLDRRSRIIADGPVPGAFPPTVPYDPLPPRAMTVTAAEPAPSAPASRSNPVNGTGAHAVNGGGPGAAFPPAVSYDPMPRPIMAVAAAQPAPAPTAPAARESNGYDGFSFATNGGATGSLAPPIDDYDPAPASAMPTTANGSTPAPHVSRREPASGPPVSLREPVPATVAALRPATEPMRTTGAAAARNGANSVAGGRQLGIHLSSFRTPERARRNWKNLRVEHGDLLDRLGARIARVDLGDDIGVFFQLRAGPIADEDAALALCSELKRRSLYCAPTIF